MAIAFESRVTGNPCTALLDWLDWNGIDHAIHEHAPAFTALDTAREEGVDPVTFAKVVVVGASDGGRALIVLDAFDQVDLRKVGRLLGDPHARLLTELELADLAPDCEVGALPAVGGLFGLSTYADIAVRDARRISFNAGTHVHSVRVDRRAWERAAAVTYADLVRSPGAQLGYVPLFDLFGPAD